MSTGCLKTSVGSEEDNLDCCKWSVFGLVLFNISVDNTGITFQTIYSKIEHVPQRQ